MSAGSNTPPPAQPPRVPASPVTPDNGPVHTLRSQQAPPAPVSPVTPDNGANGATCPAPPHAEPRRSARDHARHRTAAGQELDVLAARRLANAAWHREWRAGEESPEQRDARRAANAERGRRRREGEESPEQRDARCAANAQRDRRRREGEDESTRQARRAREAARRRELRQRAARVQASVDLVAREMARQDDARGQIVVDVTRRCLLHAGPRL